jgi:hypothetical protein
MCVSSFESHCFIEQEACQIRLDDIALHAFAMRDAPCHFVPRPFVRVEASHASRNRCDREQRLVRAADADGSASMHARRNESARQQRIGARAARRLRALDAPRWRRTRPLRGEHDTAAHGAAKPRLTKRTHEPRAHSQACREKGDRRPHRCLQLVNPGDRKRIPSCHHAARGSSSETSAYGTSCT